jgi:DNA-binding transcriptional MocR family regulator
MLDVEQYQDGPRESSERGPRLSGSTAREIAASAETAIRDGELETGDPLPTVRALATALGTSPATVNAAYRILRQRGLVVAEGRRGTRVAPRPPLRAPIRTGFGAPSADLQGLRDLTIGLPDPALLPPMAPAIEKVDLDGRLKIAGLDGPDPELLGVARRMFDADGFATDAIAIVSGALDAVERVLQAHLRPGDRVVVEDPTYPPIRDILLALGLVAVPARVDEHGIVPDALATALRRGVEALVLVPRAQNPLGAALDQERTEELRGLLETTPDVLIFGDDHAGLISGAPFATLIGPERTRWAVVRSTSKMLHPDLRVGLLCGDQTTIARVEGRQALGPRWVSHLLQAVAAELMDDPGFKATCARAADVYASRRQSLISALAGHGLAAYGRSGVNVWIPVREEAPVVRALHDAGWLVFAGEHFRLATGPGIRITIATLEDGEAAELARVIAGVENARRPRRVY